MSPSPKVLSFSQFCATRKIDSGETDHGALRFPHGLSKAQQRRNARMACRNLRAFEQAQQAYQDAGQRGEVRPLSTQERLAQQAAGHPDNPATQAAQRVIAKRKSRLASATAAA